MNKNEVKYSVSKFFGAYAKIYTLSTTDGNIFYVGCTIQDLSTRFYAHLQEAKENSKYTNQRKGEKIRQADFKVTATIVDLIWVTGECSRSALSRARVREREWISKYRDLGYELTNGRARVNVSAPKCSAPYIGQALTSEQNSNKAFRRKINIRESSSDEIGQ
jgi:hypothetical protein